MYVIYNHATGEWLHPDGWEDVFDTVKMKTFSSKEEAHAVVMDLNMNDITVMHIIEKSLK